MPRSLIAIERQKERARERSAAWRKANPERTAAFAVLYRARRKQRWDQFLASERDRYKRNAHKVLERQRLKRALDPEPSRRANRRAHARAPHKAVARCAQRRAIKLAATPRWVVARDFHAIYAEARRLTRLTGVPHEVDHIYPLVGRTFSGLHVPWNLQILPRADNRRKLNKSPWATSPESSS